MKVDGLQSLVMRGRNRGVFARDRAWGTHASDQAGPVSVLSFGLVAPKARSLPRRHGKHSMHFQIVC